MFFNDKKITKIYLGLVDISGSSSNAIVEYHLDANNTQVLLAASGENLLTKITPTKSGYTFVGWREDSTANGTVLTSKTMGSTPVELYAVFKKTCTLTAKSYNSTQTVNSTVYYNNGNATSSKVTIPTGASYSDWTWRGWTTSTSANASVGYANGAIYDLASHDATIYGLYSQTITLSYNGNGSTSGSVASQTGTRYYSGYGNTINPSFILAANGFSRTDYNFDGWDLGAAGTTITLTSNATAIAQWKYDVKYVYQNGTLASDVTNNGFTNSGGYLHLGVGADNDDSASAEGKIQNIDFTNYNKLEIILEYKNYVNYGSSETCYGIDGCWTTELPDSNNSRISKTITIDISSYTGKHFLGFGVDAENRSSEPTWHADSDVWIKQIKLYDMVENSGSSGDTTTHVHTDACYKTVSYDPSSTSTSSGYCSGCGAYYTDHYSSCSECGWSHHSRTSNCTCGQTPDISAEDHSHTRKELICGY